MRRALSEYVVSGIKTTLPFFRWLLDQPEFRTGQFHTTYLDQVLKERNGLPFVEASPLQADLAAVAAALNVSLSPGSVATAPGGTRLPAADRWKERARAEALR